MKQMIKLYVLYTLLVFMSFSQALFAVTDQSLAEPPAYHQPMIIPSPPLLNAKAYLLMDINSGKILVQQNIHEKLPPASLTKIMTLYVISQALSNHQINLHDQVRISQEAWKIGGSRMFVKQGQMVEVEDLLKGIIVDSGNDACVAMAEYLGGSETGFTEIMNQKAHELGMNATHFTDSTGMPDANHYTTAYDLGILTAALIKDFPEYYNWYKQKWFTYNGIRQPNRNRLLWRDSQVDGVKTGHTNEAGFCLVSSAKRSDMRLLAVIMNSPTDSSRADDSERLLNYGFRFFETHHLYKRKKAMIELPLYKSNNPQIKIGLNHDLFITIPVGQYKELSVKTELPKHLEAPINKDDKVGKLIIALNTHIIAEEPLYALEPALSGGIWKRSTDSIRLVFKSWLGH